MHHNIQMTVRHGNDIEWAWTKPVGRTWIKVDIHCECAHRWDTRRATRFAVAVVGGPSPPTPAPVGLRLWLWLGPGLTRSWSRRRRQRDRTRTRAITRALICVATQRQQPEKWVVSHDCCEHPLRRWRCSDNWGHQRKRRFAPARTRSRGGTALAVASRSSTRRSRRRNIRTVQRPTTLEPHCIPQD